MKKAQQKAITIIAAIFLIMMLVLTLLSNTIQTALLPKVVTEAPVSKPLVHAIEGRGMIEPKKKRELMNESGWPIEKVHVKKDEVVKKGQTLVTFDSTAQAQQIEELELLLKKQDLNRIAIKEQYVEAQRSGDVEAVRKAKRALESDDLDRMGIERKIGQQKEDIKKKGVLTAPYDGRVTEVLAEDGASIAMGQPILTLVNPSEGFQFSFTAADHAASFLQLHEKVKVEFATSKEQLEGTVDEITQSSQKSGNGGIMPGGEADTSASSEKKIVITLRDAKLKGGEEALVHIEKQAEQQGIVIRKELLKKDGNGSYVYVVREKRSPLGNTYLAEKRTVKTGDESEEEIIILDGLYPNDKIIVESSDPLQDGNRVRLD